MSGAAVLACCGLCVRGRDALARGGLHVRATGRYYAMARESDGALLAILAL